LIGCRFNGRLSGERDDLIPAFESKSISSGLLVL